MDRFISLIRHPAFVGLVLAAATLVVYWRALECDFVNYDDPEFVVSNGHVQNGVTWETVVWAFSRPLMGNWHPLTALSHALDCQLFGLRPWGHHLTSVLLHVANTVLLFLLLRRLTGALWRSALVAALFGLHPLHVESVAWVAERKDVLSTCFAWLTLLFYARYVERSKVPSPKSKVFYGLALLFFALGLMSKPMLVTLPFVMLLLDYWPLQRFTLPAAWFTIWPLLREKLPFFLLSALACVVTVWAQRMADTVASFSRFSSMMRIENALVSYGRYLGKMVWPTDLAVFYPHPGHWPVLLVLLAAALVAGLCVVAWCLGRRLPFLVTGWFWFLGTMIPVIGLVQVGGQSMADRYTYIPSVGVFIVFAWGLAQAAARWRLLKAMTIGDAIFLLGACADRTVAQLRHWQNSETLFRHALAVTQNNHIALYNLGAALLTKGNFDEAIALFHAALQIAPQDAGILSDLGVALLNQGKTDDAVTQFRAALQIRPDDAEILSNLGVAQTRQRQYDEAIANCQAAVRLKPDYAEGRVNLGNALAQTGQIEPAMAQYERALRLRPDHFGAHNGLGNALLLQKKTDAAIQHFRAALRSKPDEPATYENLGSALAAQGRFDEAIRHYTEALRLWPDRVSLHKSVGDALLTQGQLPRARVHYAAVIKAQPDNALAHYQLARVLRGQGDAAKAMFHLREAVRLNPDSVGLLNNLAWALATDVDVGVRNGAEAVQLSERAARLTEFRIPGVLDTLAAAYAESGRFAEAVETAQKALALTDTAGNERLAPGIRMRLEGYKSGRPHRE